MSKKRSTYTSLNALSSSSKHEKEKTIAKVKRARGDCSVSQSTSHTQYFKKNRYEEAYDRITTDDYLDISESVSGSSDTFNCVHGPEGKQYTDKGLLKRNILKELDPAPVDRKWNDECPPAYEWDMAKKLEFLVRDPTVFEQRSRLEAHIRDFARTSENGFRIDVLDYVSAIVDFLVKNLPKMPTFREAITLLLRNMDKPILLKAAFDIVTYFEDLRNYFGYLGYLLMRLEDDDLFDYVSKAMIWHLSAPDSSRGHGKVMLGHALAAAAPALYQTTVRMIAVATAHRFPIFMEMALLLACDSEENCLEMMKENILENIFYRFNPYYPHKNLATYDISPADPQEPNVKCGESTIHMSATMSVLLVLLKTVKQVLEKKPEYRRTLPCPDNYALRCFAWAYRYECRLRSSDVARHKRITLTVVVAVMLHIFGDRLATFATLMMPDILSLAVQTELPPRNDWVQTVNFTIGQLDVQFKKILMCLSVDMLKMFPFNQFLVETRHWLLGLMYLLDPGLCYLRARWSPAHFAEIRKIALQVLVCALPYIPTNLTKEYGLIRRIMWYIEWYSESPFELPVLYWCLRLLQAATFQRGDPLRQPSICDLYDTHGVIIIIHLCYTLMDQKLPPVEKSQAVIGICVRMLTSAVGIKGRVSCCVYPKYKWPSSIISFARKMMDVVLYSLDKNFIVSDRWLVALLNFIWEGIIWNADYRLKFVQNNGVYKLLDMITMTRAPVQCIALALVCDVARAGDAIGQLVSWRASLGASSAYPILVKRGATIASLLATIFRDECREIGVSLDEHGVIQDLEHPLMSSAVRGAISCVDFQEAKSKASPVCLAAGDLAGSRMSKVFSLLHMLSEDLDFKVSLADEAYNLYKNIKLSPSEETILVLCSYYLTIQLNQVWTETKLQSPGLLPQDADNLEEFLHIGRGWAKDIRKKQEDVIESDNKQAHEEESSLYAFLGRARLNIALDALREVRCVARSADRARITHTLLQDAVRAHHRRSVFAKKMAAPILRTYGPSLDDQNITGQYVKVYSIHRKDRPKPRDYPPSS